MLTPEQLQKLRAPSNSGVRLTDDDIVNQMRRKPEMFGDFLTKYDSAQKEGMIYTDMDGGEIPLSTAALDEMVYGNPRYSFTPKDTTPPQGYFSNIGDRILRGFGNQETRDQRTETKGFEKGFLGAVADIPGDIADVVGPSIPYVTGAISGTLGAAAAAPAGLIGSGVAGAVAAGAGAAAGENARQGIGDLIGIDEMYGTEKPLIEQNQEDRGSMKNAAISGAIDHVGGKVISAAGPLLKKTASAMSNVPEHVITWATKNPVIAKQYIQRAKDVVHPMADLAHKISTNLVSAKKEAGSKLGELRKAVFGNMDNKAINISATKTELQRLMENADTGLTIMPEMGGKTFSVVQKGLGTVAPLTDDTMARITRVMKEINKGKAVSIDDAVAFNAGINKEIRAVMDKEDGPQAVRILETLKGFVKDKIGKNTPSELKEATTRFVEAADMYDYFEPVFAKKGLHNVRDASKGAEGWLSSLTSQLKGVHKEEADKLSKFLGMDIVPEVENIKYGKILSEYEPKTGGRMFDVLKSLGISGAVGSTASASMGADPISAGAIGLGAAAITGMSSPNLVGKAAIAVGRFTQNKAFSALKDIYKTLEPAARDALFIQLKNLLDERSAEE